MDINQTKEGKTSDLIELSKCCKSYRKQLELRILESLDLHTWKDNNYQIYDELKESLKLEEVLEFLKTDLSSKLKFVKKFNLDCEIDCTFARIFVKLLPNIKSLRFEGFDDFDCCLKEGSVSIIKDMEHLEHVFFRSIKEKISDYYIKKQIFPKSIKSVRSNCIFGSIFAEDELTIYEIIDASYISLCSLTILTNRMLQRLACGMPNLLEVAIENKYTLDTSKLVVFLEANPQLRKLSIRLYRFSEEIFKYILSCKYLECLSVISDRWERLEINNLPSNYSIKYLKIYCEQFAPLTLHLINACNILKTLEFVHIREFYYLDWSKFKRRINILKLFGNSSGLGIINEIDNLKSFNQIHLKYDYSINEEICNYNLDKLNNYKLIRLISKDFIFKLIN
ncbi:hypothetical protein CONCODRAFT_19837 [Conidiobolus coronatus NRRL 28638]|uniref:RNI-like protein n=1 Tax=Conidiobolus coronatus (strain ATCC 28846 / CBS 209.66 / NRRL 28638) TaxID=796925 RepID=A0A137NWV4_CONC2|nr:hypothetical protein CONCODRAFT_19837 [Conidiobolus coronatus NRRL 28638]|eukprot:KXN67114.1 hypothetical protein CONCODRAFT_19837 [Conidiobolus coronatus NRRL 28638]